MSDREMMIVPGTETSQMVSSTPSTGTAVLPTTTSTAPAPCEHPESRHRSAVTGEMFPMGFSLRPELYNKAAIAAAVYLKNGLEFTTNRIRAGFLSQYGIELYHRKNQVTVGEQQLAHLESERADLIAVLKTTPKTRIINAISLPEGAVARCGIVVLALALLGVCVLAVFNTASYMRFSTQSWWISILSVTPLLACSVPLKAVIGKLGEKGRRRAAWIMAVIGIISLPTFIFTIAVRATPPSIQEILDGTTQCGNNIVALQVASQILMEILTACSMWFGILNLMATRQKLVTNEDAVLLTGKVTALDTAIKTIRIQLADAQGDLQELIGAMDWWVAMGAATFNLYFEQEQRLVERIKAM